MEDEKQKEPTLMSPRDPSLPTYHLVPAQALSDVMDLLKKRPYEDVYKLIPQLAASEAVQVRKPQ